MATMTPAREHQHTADDLAAWRALLGNLQVLLY
jgi:hypothetical protein